MAKKKSGTPRYEVELLLGSKKTGMHLPKNTGNWFSYRILQSGEETGTVEIGRGSIFWKPFATSDTAEATGRTGPRSPT
jgi:hypothetical protein